MQCVRNGIYGWCISLVLYAEVIAERLGAEERWDEIAELKMVG